MSYATGFRDSGIAPQIPLTDEFLRMGMSAPCRCPAPVLSLPVHRIDRSILLIDDDPAVLRLFTRILSKEGYRVRTAVSGDGCLRLLRETGFDLAIVDMGLPDIDGPELIRSIRTEGPYMPILAISGAMEPFMRSLARRAGATDTLSKPISPKWLLQTANNLIPLAPIWSRVEEANKSRA